MTPLIRSWKPFAEQKPLNRPAGKPLPLPSHSPAPSFSAVPLLNGYSADPFDCPPAVEQPITDHAAFARDYAEQESLSGRNSSPLEYMEYLA
ncbi:hypothetical protein [Chitinimonas sp. BJB300]|uniref:hypothetical protein n=1 Tax=Chitinimonas sp. BJB300 TaxID=1559339 RepID=UPI000C116E1A|nr:hypothetical protein [Chitinimonas sp. BJB300]PHV12078.1 hypothetical protein CSQ89_07640 [Chitinimonas sp. BJB300]TSJ87318.1 hypothetical protein FG002_013815 [Chitinimonas sp. BJB300]